MTDRKWIFFQGPQGAGKTTFIRRLLESTRKTLWLVYRAQPAPSPELAGEWADSEESDMLTDAGALEARVYYLADGSRHIDDPFWDPEWIEDYPEAVAFEGPSFPCVEADLYVHVMRPLADGEELVSLKEVEACRIEAMEYLKMMGIELPEDARLLSEEESEQLLQEENEAREAGDEIISEESIEIPDEVGDLIIRALKRETIPITEKAWRLHPDHDEIARCGLVVINIHDEAERPAAQRTRQLIKALRTRPELRRDIFANRYDILRVTILIANVSNPHDPELRKGLARIKRVVSRPY